jgi:hypothetical protein
MATALPSNIRLGSRIWLPGSPTPALLTTKKLYDIRPWKSEILVGVSEVFGPQGHPAKRHKKSFHLAIHFPGNKLECLSPASILSLVIYN